MRTGAAKREINVITVPRIKTIKKYDNFNASSTVALPRKKVGKKSKINISVFKLNINMKIISKILMYSSIMLLAMLIQMKFTYDVSTLGMKRSNLEGNLTELKLEIERLEDNYISNFDLKQLESKLKDMGFVYNDRIKYIKLK